MSLSIYCTSHHAGVEGLAAEDVAAGGQHLLHGEADGPERIPEEGVTYSQQLLHALPRRLDQILWTQLRRRRPQHVRRDEILRRPLRAQAQVSALPSTSSALPLQEGGGGPPRGDGAGASGEDGADAAGWGKADARRLCWRQHRFCLESRVPFADCFVVWEASPPPTGRWMGGNEEPRY